ncbi:MAG TPA: hypothetical protein VFI46_18620 [Jiangellaceae bacterium]|nr:hypothetical protein [Jiangellaceae bacterium]
MPTAAGSRSRNPPPRHRHRGTPEAIESLTLAAAADRVFDAFEARGSSHRTRGMAAQVALSLVRWFTPVALAENPGVEELGFVAAGLCTSSTTPPPRTRAAPDNPGNQLKPYLRSEPDLL